MHHFIVYLINFAINQKLPWAATSPCSETTFWHFSLHLHLSKSLWFVAPVGLCASFSINLRSPVCMQSVGMVKYFYSRNLIFYYVCCNP
jgi:hypothetical protein